MLGIRRFEERVLGLFAEGKLHGTTHACIGQEAVAAGLFAHLTPDDVVFSSHRCHGHYLLHQQDPEGLLAELMGKEGGVCGGMGGSQHLQRGNFYSNGVQGGIVPATVGMALADRFLQRRGIAVVFLGDGTLGEGQVYESFNLASLWRLPVLFVIENNHYSQSTPSHLQLAGTIAARPAAFGIPVTEVASNDVLVTHQQAAGVVAQVRKTRQPAAIVFDTFRLCSHSKSDDGRPESVIAPWRERDPLKLARESLAADLARAAEAEVEAELEQTVARVESQGPATRAAVPPLPEPRPVGVEPRAERVVTALNRALHRALEEDSRVVLLGEDILEPYGGAFKVVRGLSTAFPDRVLTTPVSEASITGLAAGMALRGLLPVLEIMFGDFLTLGLDALVNYLGKFRGMYNDQVRCPLVVRIPMGGRRGYGPTHSQSLERLAFGIPDLKVVAPNTLTSPEALLLTAVLEDPSPVLFVENKTLYGAPVRVADAQRWMGDFRVRQAPDAYPAVTLSLVDFRRADLTLVTYGGMTEIAMEAARELLIEHELAAEIVALTCLAPLKLEAVEASLQRSRGRLLTVEEGVGFAGWGSEVVARCAEANLLRGRPRRVATPATIIPSARHLEDQVLPQCADLVRAGLELTSLSRTVPSV